MRATTQEQLDLQPMDDDFCRILTGQGEIVLSYDAAYDLALKLSSYIHSVDESARPAPECMH